MKSKCLGYPFRPFLLSANSKEDLEKQYIELCQATQTQLDDMLIKEQKFQSQAGAYRKVVLFNEETKSFDKIFEQNDLCGEKRPLAFMFAGIGNQYINMAYGFYRNIRYYRELFDECSLYLSTLLNCDIRDILFRQEILCDEKNRVTDSDCDGFFLSRIGSGNAEKKLPLYQTQYSHAILFSVEYCLAKTLMYFGVNPDVLIGHSVGEYTAVAVSGAISLQDALFLIARRAMLFEKMQPGLMLTILADEITIKNLLLKVEGLYLATENSPTSYTVSGLESAILNAEKYLEHEDVLYYRLPAERAFHSDYMRPMEDEYKDIFNNIQIVTPNMPIMSNVTGDWMTNEQIRNPDSWFEHTCSTVYFSEGIKKMLNTHNPILVEIGPGQILTGFVYQQRLEGIKKVISYSSLRDSNLSIEDTVNLVFLLSKLWINGYDVNWKLVLENK